MARSISPAGTFWLLVMPCERTTTVPAMEEIQNAVLDGPVGSTQFIDSIAQKIGCGPSQLGSGCGKQPHIVQAFRSGLRWEDIEPFFQRNASICLAENQKLRRRHAFFIIVRFLANSVKPTSSFARRPLRSLMMSLRNDVSARKFGVSPDVSRRP